MVVQVRRRDWAACQQRRWGAQAVALHFALPGMMSLLNLVNPDSVLLWRVSFAAFALVGGAGMALLRPSGEADGRVVSVVAYWGAVALYTAITVVALFAGTVASVFGVNPLQVEAALLSLLLFLGLNMVFSLLFAGVPAEPDGNGRSR